MFPNSADEMLARGGPMLAAFSLREVGPTPKQGTGVQ